MGRKGDEEKKGEIIAVLERYGITLSPTHPLKVSVEIWGSGTPMREFLWSEEMADACVFLMEHIDFKDLISLAHPLTLQSSSTQVNHSNSMQSLTHEVRNTHINIGTGKEISISALAQLVKEKVGFKGELIFNTSKPDGTMRKLTDPSKLHHLGWHHQIEIEEGIEKLFRWYLE